MDKDTNWTLYGPGLGYPAERVFYRRVGDTLELIVSSLYAPPPKTAAEKIISLNSDEARNLMKL